MPTYKLMYFNGRGRAEVSRMLFAAAEKKFEDERVEFADWPKRKGETPQGSMPVLTVDGKKRYCQSLAIARYLAREFKLYGKSNDEMAVTDEILETVLDIFSPFVTAAFNKNETEKATQMETFQKETCPKVLGYLQNLVKETGKNGFAVGSALTVADLALYVYIENCHAQDSLDKFPLLAENRKKVASQKSIAAYLKARKDTQF